ncbi:MAG: AsmA-like C-terminal region-containing protein [Verrucomicrobiota bacterium]
MYRLHLTRNLRSLAFLLIVSAVLAGIGVLWWANHTGLPEPWRAAIEQQVAKQGAYIKIGSLRYAILQGIVATDVRVYSEPEHLREISRLESVILDFDKTKLARGKFHLNKIQLNHARLILPVDPKNPDSETLHVSDASGTVLMPGDRRMEVRDARGKIAGIDVALNARIIWYQHDGSKPPDDNNIGKRRELLAKVLDELEKWEFDEKHPPGIQINIEGDVNDFSSITAKLGLQVKKMTKNGHVLDEVTAEADMAGDLLTVSSLRATDADGVFEGHIDYNILNREGRFDATSSLEVPQLLAAWLALPMPKDIRIDGKQILEAEGNFLLDERNAPQVRMTGHARCEAVTLRGMKFEAVENSFSWRDGNLFLRDVKVTHQHGQAEGKAMIEWPLVRLEAHSTLPIPVYQQLVSGLKLPIETILHDFSEREGAAIDITAEGGFDFTNRHAWAYTGRGSAKNINYRGVPTNSAQCKFSLNHYELDFYEGTANFNYTKYALHKAFNGAEEGTAKVGRIRYDAPNKLVEVEDVRGLIWAAPVVRLFAAKVADSLEQYRFHQPPDMRASGVVDVTPQGRTALDISFSSDHPADYQFLGTNLTLGRPRGQVTLRGDRVTVSNLKVDAFDGPVAGNIEYLGGGRLAGDLNWTKLSIPDLASTYGFQMKGGGSATGRIDFSLTDGKVETMDGEGLLALEKAELFSVPMFGPLSPVIGNVLNDDKAAFQSARNAFCTFRIRNGILSSNDFQTSTNSLNFAGEGSVDMNNRTLDMTMRMNARGFLLGLITIPLRPFSGLFQFHGTGPLKETKWESMKFTPPPETQREILLDPPKAKVISGGG